MNKVMVIGSNSFSGQDFVDLLLDETDCRVIGVSRSPEKPPVFCRYRLRDSGDSGDFTYHQLDLNDDAEAIGELLERERPDVIVNFAAQSEVAPSWDNPWHWYQTNVVALSKLTQRLIGKDWLDTYVHISSPEVYGTTEGIVHEDGLIDPSTPYAASKAAADLHLSTLEKNFDFPLAWIRATNVYGPGQQLFKIIPRSFIRIRQGETIQLHGGGVAVKSYIHIRDVSRAELAVAAGGRRGGWHVSPDEGVEVREVVGRICDAAGVSFDTAVEAVEERLGQDRAYVISSERARADLGWKPEVSLEEGISQTGAWIDENWAEIERLPHDYQHQK